MAQQPHPPEFMMAKARLREATIHHADLKFSYDLAHAEYKALMDEIDRQTKMAKLTYETAQETYKSAEEARKTAHKNFKGVKKGDPNYNELKSLYELARINKEQAEQAKKTAHSQLEIARTPFKDKIEAATQTKQKAHEPYQDAKTELTAATETFRVICQQCFAEPNALITYDAEMRTLAMEILSSRRQINSLEAWLKTALAILRDFVSTNPIGFTNGDLESEDGYPLWIDLADSVMVILESNPGYTIPRDRLIELIGKAAFIDLVTKVSHSVVAKAVEAGELINITTGEKMTLEELTTITTVDEKTPRVKVSPLGSVRKSDLAFLITPEFLQMPVAQAEEEGNLPSGTADELQQQGITTFGQLFSQGVGLATTKMLGKEKATALFGMLQKLRQ